MRCNKVFHETAETDGRANGTAAPALPPRLNAPDRFPSGLDIRHPPPPGSAPSGASRSAARAASSVARATQRSSDETMGASASKCPPAESPTASPRRSSRAGNSVSKYGEMPTVDSASELLSYRTSAPKFLSFTPSGGDGSAKVFSPTGEVYADEAGSIGLLCLSEFPFNAEPTLPDLMRHGFITPVSSHYVRNDGIVPRAQWDTHTISVKGAVSKPRTFTLDEIIVALPGMTIPVTLACAGNRGKELNSMSATHGLSWGPGAVSTGYWTGVRFCDLMKLCGIRTPSEGARHICFSGPGQEMPEGGTGSYGSSLPYEYLMNPANDVMIAYKHNGQRLTPDHGFPVRVIIPGFACGRMVKRLSEIVVQEGESTNPYHYKSNRLLPPQVTMEMAESQGWLWNRPEYLIGQLNINSVISSPAHGESISKYGDYTIKGYCYTGGGRKIIRVEVSFDQGTTCELGTINQVEEATEYGRHWCWVFWELSTTAERMAGAPEIWCRGWDEAQNTQPEASTWNAAGVMNNGVFKLRVAADGSSVSFQQPTQPGPLGGGYMVNKSAELKAKPLGPITLNKKKVKLPLEKKTVISPDTVILRLSLPSKDHLLGLPCGQHMFIYLKGPDGKLVIRAYTPITGDNVRGYVDLLIKVYRCCEQFPKGGEMSQLLDSLAIGDQVEVKGPIGHFHYLGRGRYTKDDVPGTCRRLSMVAGGTGITPMWQVLQEVLADPEDKTEIRLLFANRHTEDILLKEELDALAAKHDNFAVRYTLSGRCPEGWDQCTGRITKEMLESHIFPTGDDETLCLLCGPQGMIDVAAKPNLEKMGYKESSFVIF